MAKKWTAEDIPDQSGRVAVVTGANSGLGAAVAGQLARRGAQVILACRDTVKGEAAAKAILAESPKGSTDVGSLDLGDLGSARATRRASHPGLSGHGEGRGGGQGDPGGVTEGQHGRGQLGSRRPGLCSRDAARKSSWPVGTR